MIFYKFSWACVKKFVKFTDVSSSLRSCLEKILRFCCWRKFVYIWIFLISKTSGTTKTQFEPCDPLLRVFLCSYCANVSYEVYFLLSMLLRNSYILFFFFNIIRNSQMRSYWVILDCVHQIDDIFPNEIYYCISPTGLSIRCGDPW